MNESVFAFIWQQNLMNQLKELQRVCSVTSPASDWLPGPVCLRFHGDSLTHSVAQHRPSGSLDQSRRKQLPSRKDGKKRN